MSRLSNIFLVLIFLSAVSVQSRTITSGNCADFFLGFAQAQLSSDDRALNILQCDKDNKLEEPVRNLILYLVEGKTKDNSFNILTPLLESIQQFSKECYEDVNLLISPFARLFEEIKAGADVNQKLMEKAQKDKKAAVKVLGIFTKLKKGLTHGQFLEGGKQFSELLDIVKNIYNAEEVNSPDVDL